MKGMLANLMILGEKAPVKGLSQSITELVHTGYLSETLDIFPWDP